MPLKPIKVSQLNNYISKILGMDPLLGNVRVSGEIANLKFHDSGHIYFSLKDENSTVRCFFPSYHAKQLRYEIENGMQVVISGYISVYERGGYYSINIKELEAEGMGTLSIAFENIKRKLLEEGVFDSANKKPLPKYPEKIAIVTARTGAALQDMLKIITSKNSFTDVLIYPALVQGTGAAQEIAKAIDIINREYDDVQIIIVGRGGGSQEDLWAFNEECVARAIFKSRIPVISAVGHETDVTIADFAADVRAETPTAAASMAVFDSYALQESLLRKKDDMLRSVLSVWERYRYLLDSLKKQLDGMNPKRIKKMGLVSVTDTEGNQIKSVHDVKTGDMIHINLSDGIVAAQVKELKEMKE